MRRGERVKRISSADCVPKKIVEPSGAQWRIVYMGKQEAVIHDADGRIALVCPIHNAELIVNAVNAYNNLRDENARLLDENWRLRNEMRIARMKEEEEK